MKKINFKCFFLIIQIFISVISPLLGMQEHVSQQQDTGHVRTFLGLVAERCYSFEIPLTNIEPIKYFDKKLYQQCNTDFFSPLQTIKNTLQYPINILKLLKVFKDDFIFDRSFSVEEITSAQNHFLFAGNIQKAVLLCIASYVIYTKKEEWCEKLIKWQIWKYKPFNNSVFVDNKFFVKDIFFYYVTVAQLINILNNGLVEERDSEKKTMAFFNEMVNKTGPIVNKVVKRVSEEGSKYDPNDFIKRR